MPSICLVCTGACMRVRALMQHTSWTPWLCVCAFVQWLMCRRNKHIALVCRGCIVRVADDSLGGRGVVLGAEGVR